jgi:two-component system, LytTR family, response regulator
MSLKVVIADDEPLARERLRFLLTKQPDVEIVAECRNAREVVSHLKSHETDLLLLDIQMPRKSAFDIFEEIGAARMPLTVFVTAHQQYAVKAFNVRALDYLTKPIELERLQSALALARERLIAKAAMTTHQTFASVLANLETKDSPGPKYPKRFLVPNGAKNSFVAVDEIEWIEAADYYSCLHVGSRTFLMRETIKQLGNLLDPVKFVRIHRSIIVNVEQVGEILREGRNEGSVILTGGQRLKMSKVGWQRLLCLARRPGLARN